MKTNKLIFLILCLVPALSFGQTLKGTVQDSINHTGVQYATVKLMRGDSLFRGTITNEKGKFSLQDIPAGNYTMHISFIGFAPYKTNLKIGNKNQNIGIVSLKPSVKEIDEVTVKAHKNKYKQLVDRTVVTFSEKDIKTHPKALQALSKISGLRVSKRGNNIQLLGKENLLILINGVTKSAQEISMLKTADIARVELITNPGAEYESTYTSVLNIITKKNSLIGFALDADLYAYYPNIYNFSNLKIQYGFDKIKLYGYYSLWLRRSESEYQNNIKELENNVIRESLDTTKDAKIRLQTGHYVNYGADIFFNANNFLNISGDFHAYTQNIPTKQSIYTYENDTIRFIHQWERVEKYEDQSQNYSLYFQHKFNKNNSLYFNATYYQAQMHELISSRMLNDINKSSINQRFVRVKNSQYYKLNYNGMIARKYKIQIGTYNYFRNLTNWFYDNDKNQEPLNFNEMRLNSYIHLSGGFNKVNFSASWAVEYQNYLLNNTHKLNLNHLPSFNIQWKIAEKQTIGFRYSRKLRYPDTYQLADYVLNSDSLNIYIGNPNVRAFHNEHIGVNYAYRFNGVFIKPSINYTYFDSPILKTLNLSSDGKLLHSYANEGKIHKLNFSLRSSFSIGNLDLNPSVSIQKNIYDTPAGNWVGNNWEVSFSPDYTFENGLNLSTSLYYKSKSTVYLGYETMTPSIDFSISQDFLDDKLSVLINIVPFNDYYTTVYNLKNTYIVNKEMEHYQNINFEIIYSFTQGKKLRKQQKDINTDSDF